MGNQEYDASARENYDRELRKRLLSTLDDAGRLLRADAEAMESLRAMIAVASEEVRRNPQLLFATPTVPTAPLGEGGIIGGQTPFERVLDKILAHIEREKPIIQEFLKGFLAKL